MHREDGRTGWVRIPLLTSALQCSRFRLLSFIDPYNFKLKAYSKAIYRHYKNNNLSVTYFCILFHQGAR